MEKSISKKKFVIVVTLLLILFFIIIFLLLKYIGKINDNELIPTGNIDIFDINKCPTCNCKDNNCDNNNETNINTSENKEHDDSYGVFAYDDEVIFNENVNLNIFKQTSYYVKKDRIAPNSYNSYQFVIRNSTDVFITYNLDFIEDNKYNINMKYRLKRNGSYVVGNEEEYVTAKELSQYNINLDINNYDVYMLDWKWFSSPNDTEIGSNIDSHYGLSIKLLAEEK